MEAKDSKIECLGSPIKTTFILDSLKGVEDGKDVLYFSVTGVPSTFVVYDVNEKKTIRKLEHKSDNEPTKCSWSQVKDNYGNIYMASTGSPAKIFKYDIKDKMLYHICTLKEESCAAYHLSCDEKNNIYFGTALDGSIYKYDTYKEELSDYGTIIPGEKYVISSVYYNDALYCGSRSENPKFYRFDLKTGEYKIIDLPEKIKGKANAVYYMSIVENYIFPIIKTNKGDYVITCFNAKTEKWENIYENGLGGHHMTEVLDRITYFVAEDGYIKGINLDTLEVINTGILYYYLEKGDDGFDYANGFMNGGFFILKDQQKYPGYTYITSNYDNNALAYINMTNKTVEFVNSGSILSNPIEIKAMTSTPKGNIVLGGYMSTKGVLYDIDKNEFSEFYCRQTEGMASVGDKTYFGVYTRATMWEFDENKPYKKEINPRQLFKTGKHQDRPFAMCEADGKLLYGTIPDYYQLGGALCLYNPQTKENKVWHNVINNQSITGVCYRKGIAYASTGVWGGLSSVPKERDAKVFSFDLQKGKVIKEASLHFPFSHGEILHIGGLVNDSEDNIWGITSGVVFKLNPDTLEVTDYVNISGINWNIEDTTWRPFSLVESGDYIYCNPEDRLVRINKKTLNKEEYNVSAFMIAKGKDNRIYFCDSESLYRI